MNEPIDRYTIDVDNFHHIQRDILARLYTVETGSYAELKPRELTGNAFNYHLRHVLSQSLIEQVSEGTYRLSPLGRLLLDNVSLETMRLKLRPVIGVIPVIETSRGLLLYEANRAPLRGYVGFPFGKLRLGDALEATFERIVRRRQLDSDLVKDVRQVGMANIRYFENGELVSHRVATVVRARFDGEPPGTETKHGSSRWQSDLSDGQVVLEEVRVIEEWPKDRVTVEITAELALSR